MAEHGSENEIRHRKKVKLDGIEVENRIRQEVGLPPLEPEKVLKEADGEWKGHSKKEGSHSTEGKEALDVIEVENRIRQEVGLPPIEPEKVLKEADGEWKGHSKKEERHPIEDPQSTEKKADLDELDKFPKKPSKGPMKEPHYKSKEELPEGLVEKFSKKIQSIEDAIFIFKNEIYPNVEMALKQKGIRLEKNQSPKVEQIKGCGYRNFLFALEKNKITYTELLQSAGYKVNYEKDKWKGLDLETAVSIFLNKIYPKVKERLKEKGIELKENQTITEVQIKDCGLGDFISAIERIGIQYTNLLKYAGFKPNLEKGKWDNLNLETAVKLFKYEIYPNAIKIIKSKGFELEQNQTLTVQQLKDCGYGFFIKALRDKGIKYNNLLIEAAFKIIHEMGKWKGFNLETAVSMFLNKIYPEVKERLKKKSIVLKENLAPSLQDLTENGFSYFVSAIFAYNIKYSNVIKESGLILSKEISKYENLTLESAANLFQNEIFPKAREKLKEIGIELDENQVPIIRQLRKVGFGYLISAMQTKNISYVEIIEKIGLEPNVPDIIMENGRNFHMVAELIFLKHASEKHLRAYREICPSKIDNLNHCDNTLIVDEHFINASKLKKIKNPQNIEMINIDYTVSSESTILLNKCNKGYQGKNKILIIVPLINDSTKISTPKNIPYRENVVIMNPHEFNDFIGYEDENKKDFEEVIKLTRTSAFDLISRKVLRELAKKSWHSICEKFEYSQTEFEAVLKKRGKLKLLKQSSDFTKIDRWLKDDLI